MTTNTVEKSSIEEMMARLAPIDFDVKLEPLFRRSPEKGAKFVEVGARAVVNTDADKVVHVVSSKYELMPYRDTILPMCETLFKQGWQLAERETGRSPVRIESNGRRVYVELIHPDVKLDLGVKQNGKPDLLSPRFVAFNSYDTTGRLGAMGGAYQWVCTNGLKAPSKDMLGYVGRRHMGGNSEFDAKRVNAIASEYLENFESLLGGYRKLIDIVPGEMKALAAIEAVSVRSKDRIVELVEGEYLDKATGWQVFSGITNYLTHSFKGGERLFNGKQREALDVLLAK